MYSLVTGRRVHTPVGIEGTGGRPSYSRCVSKIVELINRQPEQTNNQVYGKL